MNVIRQNRFATPMLHWLFFLFMSTGFYCFQERPSIGKPFTVEHVYTDSRALSDTKHIADYHIASQKNVVSQRSKLQSRTLTCLSRELDNLVNVTIIQQASKTAFLPQNTMLHFQPRTLCSGDDDSIA